MGEVEICLKLWKMKWNEFSVSVSVSVGENAKCKWMHAITIVMALIIYL